MKLSTLSICALLFIASLTSRSDEILYWIIDNPTIDDMYGSQYKLSERSVTVSGSEMKFVRIAALNPEIAETYELSRLNGGVDDEYIVFLNLYDTDGRNWVITPNDTSVITDGGKVEPYQRSSIAASLSASIPGVDRATYSFAVELGMYNDNGDWIVAAISGLESYDKLIDYRSQQIDIPYAIPWQPDIFYAPEPSSGILILIGLALMGLKRKKLNMEV